MQKKLFVVVNIDSFLLSHRKEIALAAKQKGFQVTIVAHDTGRREEIEALGLRFINLPNAKSVKNIFKEFYILIFLFTLYKTNKPDIVHHVGLKLILYGTTVAKFTGIENIVNAVSGLGILFSGFKIMNKILKTVTICILKFIHNRKNIFVIFQNDEDKNIFIASKIINENQAYKIKGSGVDLSIYQYTPEPNNTDKVRIIFAARMLRDKGVLELVDAARLLKKKYYHKAQFLLCGDIDDNPKSLTKIELENTVDGEYIQWLGHRNDVRKLLGHSHIFAFPSYYREGLPKSLIEACAVGRPIITTNSIGCKDCVIDNYNGFLVPIQNSKALADMLAILIDDKELRISMGQNSRIFAEKIFSIITVVDTHMEIYNRLVKQIHVQQN